MERISWDTVRTSSGINSSFNSNQRVSSSWFEEGISRWRELCCTAPFAKFCARVAPYTGSLTLILYHQSEIIKALVAGLDLDQASIVDVRLAAGPLSNLVALLAKDLGEEFVPHLPTFVPIFVRILEVESEDASLAEAILSSLFYLVKNLEKRHAVDVLNSITSVEKMFQTKRKHLRLFLIQLYGYIARKCDNPILLLERLDGKPFAIDVLVESVFEKQNKRLLQIATSTIMEKLQVSSTDLLFQFSLQFLSRASSDQQREFLWKKTLDLCHENFHNVQKFTIQAVPISSGFPFADFVMEHLNQHKEEISTDDAFQVIQSVLKHSELSQVLKNREAISRIVVSNETITIKFAMMLMNLSKADLFDPLIGKLCLSETLCKAVEFDNDLQEISLATAHKWINFDKDAVNFLQRLASYIVGKLDSLNGASFEHSISILAQYPKYHEHILKRLEDSLSDETCNDSRIAALLDSAKSFGGIAQIPNRLLCNLEVLRKVSQISFEQVSDTMMHLSHPNHQDRLHVLKLIQRAFQNSAKPCLIINELVSLEMIPWTFNCDRAKRIHFDAIHHLACKEGNLDIEAGIWCLFGLAHNGFQLVQADIARVMQTFSQNHSQKYLVVARRVIGMYDDQNSPLSKGSFLQLVNILEKTSSLASPIQTELVNLVKKTFFDASESCTVSFVKKSLKSLFTILSNLKITRESSEILEPLVIDRFLKYPDNAIQNASLSLAIALPRFTDVGRSGWLEHLRNLISLNDVDLKETLALLTSNHALLADGPLWKDSIIEILVPILIGRMIGREKIACRRAIIAYISIWDEDSLKFFTEKLLKMNTSNVDNRNHLGFLSIAEAIIPILLPVLNDEVRNDILVRILNLAKSTDEKIRSLAMKRIVQFFTAASTNQQMEMSNFFNAISHEIIDPRIDTLEEQLSHSKSAMMNLFVLWAQSEHMISFLKVSSDLLPVLAKMLGSVSQSVILDQLITIFECLCASNDMASLPIACLLESLKKRIDSSMNFGKQTTRIISILIPLATCVSREDLIYNGLVNILTDLLGKSIVPEVAKSRILEVLANLAPCSKSVDPLSLAPLFFVLRSPNSFKALCRLTDCISNDCFLEWIKKVGPLLCQMHAYTMLDEPDYEVRQSAFSSLRAIIDSSVDNTELIKMSLPAVLFYLIGDAEEIEASFRTQASFTIRTIIKKASESKELQEVVLGLLIPAIKTTFKAKPSNSFSKVTDSKEEALSLLGELVSAFPEHSLFKPFVPLHGDPEASIFSNLFHVQVHRRVRALKRLSSHIGADWSRELLEQIILPLLHSFVFPSSEDADEKSIPPLVHQEALGTYSIALAALPTRQFSTRVVKLLRLLKKTCASDSESYGRKMSKSLLKLIPMSVTRRNEGSDELVQSILEILQATSADPKWIPLTAAAGHLVKFQTEEQRQINLPKLFTMLASILKNRESEIREAARSAMNSLIVSLGSEYLPALLHELQAFLGKGPQRHVLSFTMHSILLNLAKNQSTGLPEAAVEVMVSTGLEDLFDTTIFKEKTTTEWTGKMEEVKAQRGHEIIGLVVKLIPVLDVLAKVIVPLQVISQNSTFKENVEKSLGAIEKSLAAKIDGLTDEALPVMFALIHELTKSSLSQTSLYDHQFQLLGLRLLGRLLKCKNVASTADRSTIASLVSPFVPIVLAFLLDQQASRHASLVVASIKTLGGLLTIHESCQDASVGLSGLEEEQVLLAVSKRLFQLIATSAKAKQVELIAASFKMISRLVRTYHQLQLTESQIRALLAYARDHLETNDRQTVSFSLISSLVSRKIVLPELLDLLTDTLPNLMLTSTSEATRAACRGVFGHFLLQYPMAPARHEEHLAFLVKNATAFEWESVRVSALLLMQSLAAKMPLETILALADTWIVALASRLANEVNQSVVSVVEATIEAVASRLDQSKQASMVTVLERWFGSPKHAIRSIAWHLARILCVAGMTSPISRIVIETLPSVLEEESNPAKLVLECFTTVTCLAKRDAGFLAKLSISSIFPAMIERYPVAGIRYQLNLLAEEYLASRKEISSLPSMAACLIAQLGQFTAPVDQGHVDQLIRTLLSLATEHFPPERAQDDCTRGIHSLLDILNRLEKGVRQYKSGEDATFVEGALKFLAGLLATKTTTLFTESIARPAISVALRVGHDGGSTYPEALRPLATDLLDLLETVLGADLFSTTAHQINRAAAAARLARRAQETELAVTHPEAYTRRKTLRNEAKKGQRKRKIDQHRREKSHKLARHI